MAVPWRWSTAKERDPSGDTDDDAELVRSAQVSARAFAPLYLRYRDPILNYCYYRLGDREAAEDAASTIFVKALLALPRFADHENSFRTWLFRIAHNEITDLHRQRFRHLAQSLSQHLELRDPALSPEDVAVAADRREHVLGLLNHLPARERSVLELRVAELTTAEIAQVLAISEQSVRTAQCRAVSRLRGLLARVEVAHGEAADA